MIIIFSSENDLSTIAVAKWLRYFDVEFYVINPTEGVYNFIRLDQDSIIFYNTHTKKEINLLDATSCWWRRTGLGKKNFIQESLPSQFFIDDFDATELISGKKSALDPEISDLKEYIFNKVYNTCKINLGHPKLYGLNRLETLELAQKFGIKTPQFEVVTNYSQIYNSNICHNELVTKAISNGIYHQIDNRSFYTYTELIKKKDFEKKEMTLFPSLILELVPKKYEIRSFFIEGNFYSMAIFSQSNQQTEVDFRKYSSQKPNKNEPYKLPQTIENSLRNLFAEFQLNCGSIDLIKDINDEYIFLEINPVGQYGMTSEPCNYNIDRKIAEYLIYGRIY